MDSRIHSVDSQINSNIPLEIEVDFSLETAELEMILTMKAEEQLEFSTALPSALASSGNEWLFDFPADRFPIPARSVAAVKLNSGDDQKICYAYEAADGAGFFLASENDLDPSYIAFAQSYADVAHALEPIMTEIRGADLH